MRRSLFLFFYSVLPLISLSQVSVLTQHNDLARTGANLNETHLSVASVNPSTFGKIFSREVDDQVYTQPLVVSGVNIPNAGKRNVVYVATVNNTVYAFDADDAANNSSFWQENFTPAGTAAVKNTDMTGACGGNYLDFSGNMGIVGTPVIDTIAQAIYFVSRDKVISTGIFEQWLHAVDITDGSEKLFSPVLITAKYQGSGDGSVNDTITFDPQKQNQRPALTLVNGVIWIAWASHCDWGPYHGWVIGYDAATFEQTYVWMNTPEGYNGGIWMSGQGISADDDGNLYLSTGNGSIGNNGDPADTINRGESFLKLKPSGSSLKLMSFFTPHNYQYLEDFDVDLGSQGILLVPNTHFAISGGKEGKMYVVNRDTMGGVDTVDHVTEKFDEGSGNQLHGGPVFWHSDTADYIYVWAANQYMHAYKVSYNPMQPLDLPAAMTSGVSSSQGQQGGMLAISANGSSLGSGILWATLPLSGDANHETRPGILRAYDADDLSHELWNSQINPAADSIGGFAKFVCPTIANGKVYIATFSGQLLVYGLFAEQGTEAIPGEENNWSLYPNPSTDEIALSGYLTNFIHQSIVIIDVTGKEWYRFSSNDLKNKFNTTIDVHAFPAGVYFVNLSGSVKSFVKK
ncbi:MAG TPA: T9SS type A sorting domain-containing protein [Chitinophagales bacterium]|nr:T9SS type A sorting domain-containing protein [Chitinophagales bacterium]